jgi:rfaE bifunctional protein kinase chain/domain/rfaE bifunctional protein nucleotidyltransferase chain/domain
VDNSRVDSGRAVTATTSMRHLLEKFRDVRALVLGDAVLDVWRYAGSDRLAREAPVPVFDVSHVECAPGAAANCAANAAALGARVEYVGIIGADAAGVRLRAELEARAVGTALLVEDSGARTATKQRLVSDGEVIARFDSDCRSDWSAAALERLRERVLQRLEHADVVVVADYGNGALAPTMPDDLAQARDRIHGPLVVDGHRFDRWRACHPTAMTPSLGEMLPPEQHDRSGTLASLRHDSQQLLERSGAELLLLTLDARGTLLHQRARAPHRTRTRAVARQRTCGAGDTVTTAFALALAAGADPPDAADLAQEAANVVVGRDGTSCCSAEQLSARCGSARDPGATDTTSSAVAGGALSRPELEEVLREHRAAGRRIVFTNGCFDVLHAGHVTYLEQARALGDVLVVALNSDVSVRRLKGPGRPVIPEAGRSAMLAGLRAVDHVVVFDEATPEPLLELVRPEIYVKGGDYSAQMLSETAVVERLGGEVVIVDYVEGHSTTELVERIRGEGSFTAARQPQG